MLINLGFIHYFSIPFLLSISFLLFTCMFVCMGGQLFMNKQPPNCTIVGLQTTACKHTLSEVSNTSTHSLLFPCRRLKITEKSPVGYVLFFLASAVKKQLMEHS